MGLARYAGEAKDNEANINLLLANLKERIGGPNGHLSNEACANALVDNASPCLRHVWLCHLSDENNHPELAKKTIKSVLRDKGIIAGKDFMLDVLKRKTPSEVFNLI